MTSIELGWGSLSEEGARALSGRLDGEVSNPIMPVLMTPRCQQLWTLVVGSRCSSSPRLRLWTRGNRHPKWRLILPADPRFSPGQAPFAARGGLRARIKAGNDRDSSARAAVERTTCH